MYVVSAGIKRAVEAFCKCLGISISHVFVVDVYFKKEKQFDGYEENFPMTYRLEKHEIIENLRKNHPRIAHIGDGMNDVEADNLVERFIWYGGAYYRHHIAEMCDFYIKTKILALVLPLFLTLEEHK
ncbi:hypothetical protein [Coxiella-like endosymbiont]|uniref:hypothetical protein n=1 Tax=Coxiella-like endosymbiont TaxID=1592897 RepID=UPI00272CCEAF|nr:hypothetical protein [Coxiella-like endosymbiont]